METLGGRATPAEVWVPERTTAPVARFAGGDVVLLPADHQLVPGRVTVPARVTTPRGQSFFLPPAETHGLWLELREPP